MKRKKIPWAATLALDLAVVAVYVLGFYGIYYRMPRALASNGVQTVQTASSGSSSLITASASTSTQSAASSDSSDSSSSSSSSSSDSSSSNSSSSTPTVTDSSYTSSGVSVSVQKYTTTISGQSVTYYVADVQVSSIDSIQAVLADDTYGVGYTESVLSMGARYGAILAVNGDYYGNSSDGVVIRNGEVYRTNTNGMDVCVLYRDGTMVTYSADEFDADEVIANGAWQAWEFGPALLDSSGNTKTSFTSSGNVSRTNPRTAIGYYSAGHYCIVVVDGRDEGGSAGISLSDLSQLMKNLGCTAAYNLDGGKSSVLEFNGSIVNDPVDGGREVTDAIIIKEA